ncbi:hypothetical protein F5887DRAFT_917599 [Amanita rubescens]|nr:hypothetical protein F5887DRAFT_917599 [Amanita rubescens]
MPVVMRRDAEGPFEHGMRRLNEYGYAVYRSWGEKKKNAEKKKILARVPRWNDAGVYEGADSVREAWDVAAEGCGECEKRNEGEERGLRVLMGEGVRLGWRMKGQVSVEQSAVLRKYPIHEAADGLRWRLMGSDKAAAVLVGSDRGTGRVKLWSSSDGVQCRGGA